MTGTAAWNYFAITQYILGIRPEYDGLLIDPCIPSTWKEYKVVRRFRNAIYKISVINRNGRMKGVQSIYLDGQKIEGNILPLMPAGKIYEVEVIM